MTNWTNSAKSRLEAYFTQIHADLQASGVDVAEVTEDLRRHIEQEAAALNLAVVTEQDVGNILGRIGAPEMARVLTATPPPAPAVAKGEPPARRPGSVLFFFGFILPLGTILFEFLTGACAAVLFDPLPTFAHVLLTLAVPLSNLWIWLCLRERAAARPVWMGLANGLSVGVALVYGLMLIPASPFAAIGVLFYGAGLVPLAPYLALFVAIVLGTRLAAKLQRRLPPRWWTGFGIGFAVLAIFTLPLFLTKLGMQMAVAEEVATRTKGISLLRACGQDEEILRTCYGRSGRSGELYNWGTPIGQEAARKLYYQVRGRAFNSVMPPKLYAGRARWTLLEQEFTWDNDQGGDAVAGRVKGLSLMSSRQDIVTEPDAGLAYLEWTMEFKNTSLRQREARTQLLLPPGSVVSRLTLWINGEEREAAFGGRNQVKDAYKQVVTARHDPVLVTTCGPDRVLVQCFPVPPSGGTMKARIGITAPIVLTNRANGFLRLPSLIERNFSIQDDLRHLVWIDSPELLSCVSPMLIADSSKAGLHSLRGSLSDKQLADPTCTVVVQRNPGVDQVWARDTRQENSIVRQRTIEKPIESPGAVVLVVDGTAGMDAARTTMAKALPKLPKGVEFSVLVAYDGVQGSMNLHKADDNALNEAATLLRRSTSEGGHDNVPALVRAWDMASRHKNGMVIWVHGPQPELFDTFEELKQLFERRAGGIDLVTIQCSPGPNRLLEKLDGAAGVRSLLRAGDLEQDLGRLFATLAPGHTVVALARERVTPAASEAETGRESSLQLVRLWASDECARLRNRQHDREAMTLAVLYQLVTPVSGAVVLETQAQYDRAGLQPVPPTSVPMIPEPSAAALLLLAIGIIWFHRFVRRRVRTGIKAA
jgi:hypothetical protein